MSDLPAGFFDKSIIVVAHPDDEILWFSSILDKVDHILCCYEDCAGAPALGTGRRKTLSEYPLRNIDCLGLPEPVSFDTADWQDPVETPFGIRITTSRADAARYERNYPLIESSLATRLAGYRNVFTHNPWGEYGHEDHVQVFRAIAALQDRLGYTVWVSNYCGNRSYNLMLARVAGFSSDYVSLPTNVALAGELQALYKRNNCWTWYNDYQWFREECFMKAAAHAAMAPCGHMFPLNIIKTDFALRPPRTSSRLCRIVQACKAKIGRCDPPRR